MRQTLFWISWAASLCHSFGAYISVGPNGTGTNSFSTYEQATNGWTSQPQTFVTFSTNITNSAGLDAAVQTRSADIISRQISATSTTPPDPGPFADWHVFWRCLVMSSAGVDFTPLLATLRNDTGTSLTDLTVSYFAADGATNGHEHVPRLRAYFSLSGASNTWQVIPEFCNATGHLSATLQLGCWPSNALLYLLWADENGPAGRDVGSTSRESINIIDDFSAAPAVRLTAAPIPPAKLRLTWLAFDPAFVLEATTNLNSADWQLVSPPPVLTNGEFRVDVDPLSGARFFRLTLDLNQREVRKP